MVIKSERLKKLENELHDLQHWLKLGLVPKRDMEKHTQEIEALQERIAEELDRLRELKESGDGEEYVAPKRGAGGRQNYQEPQTLPGIDIDADQISESNMDTESESYDTETTISGTEERTSEYTLSEEEEEDDEDPFSDRNRWRRGILEDVEGDQW